MIFRNIRPVEVNNGRYAAILNLIELKFIKIHPLLKPYNFFYSNGVAILSGFQDISQNISDVINLVKVLGQFQGPKT